MNFIHIAKSLRAHSYQKLLLNKLNTKARRKPWKNSLVKYKETVKSINMYNLKQIF